MKRVRSKDTEPELRVRQALHRQGFRFRLHRKDLPGSPDIVLPRYKTAIFVHGCFWHGHTCSKGKPPESNKDFWNDKISKNKQRDHRNSLELAKIGWNVIILWECEVYDSNQLSENLLKFIPKRITS